MSRKHYAHIISAAVISFAVGVAVASTAGERTHSDQRCPSAKTAESGQRCIPGMSEKSPSDAKLSGQIARKKFIEVLGDVRHEIGMKRMYAERHEDYEVKISDIQQVAIIVDELPRTKESATEFFNNPNRNSLIAFYMDAEKEMTRQINDFEESEKDNALKHLGSVLKEEKN